jgi:putative Holliday junction resolvase
MSQARYIGIDFGTKRIGIAVSDESNTFALPRTTIQNNKQALDELNTIVCDLEPQAFVIGESKNYAGQENPVMVAVRAFKAELERRFAKPVLFEPEFLTSHQVERVHGKTEHTDASAAAIILQSFLDRMKNN